MTSDAEARQELDVRGLPKPARHPRIIAAFESLTLGDAFVLVNDHDPRHLREEFERDLAGSYGWEYVRQEAGDWRVRISRTASTPLPRVLVNTGAVAAVGETDAAGAVWRLDPSERELDANLIALPAHDTIDEHAGPDLDVLLHVVAGSGVLRTEGGDVTLTPGAVVYLPRGARRAVTAGAEGLRYLSVHRRKSALPLMPAVVAAPE